MSSLIFDLTQKAAEHAFKITPYNGVAFGALVFVLGFFAYTFYKDNKEKDEKLHDLSDKSLRIIALVEEKLPDPAEMRQITDKLNELKELIRDIQK